MKPLIGLIAGIFLGYVLQLPIDEKFCVVIIFAAVDSILGGLVAVKFSDFILIGEFFTNLAFGFILILLGNFFGIDLYYVALFVFGLNIFKSISTLRTLFIEKYNT